MSGFINFFLASLLGGRNWKGYHAAASPHRSVEYVTGGLHFF